MLVSILAVALIYVRFQRNAFMIYNLKGKDIFLLFQTLKKFLNKFDTRGQEDGIVDQDEFLGFCVMLSATIKEDIYFEHALRTLFDFRL